MKNKTWENLNSHDLALTFGRLFGVDIHLGRDSALLKRTMEDYGLSPIQVLYGFLLYLEMPGSKYVHAFCLNVDFWRSFDPLEAAAEVCIRATGKPTPVFYWEYLDFRGGGDTGDARATVAYTSAKTKLEVWIGDWLRQPFEARDRTLFIKRATEKRKSGSDLPEFRFDGE